MRFEIVAALTEQDADEKSVWLQKVVKRIGEIKNIVDIIIDSEVRIYIYICIYI